MNRSSATRWARRAVLGAGGVLTLSAMGGSGAGCVIRNWHRVEGTASERDLTLDQLLADAERAPLLEVLLLDGSKVRGRLVRVDFVGELLVVRDDYKDEIEIPAAEIVQVKIGELQLGGTIALSAVGLLGAVLLAMILTLAVAIALKTSCPFVYVEGPDGWVLAGEGYSGAVAGALQRPDRLAIPLPTGPLVRVRLADEAHETQYTDAAWLVLVDHPADTRVLGTLTDAAVAVGPPQGPVRVTDLSGADVTAAVAAADDRIWTSDLDAAARAGGPFEEGLIAEVAAAPPHAALELTYANSPMLDRVAAHLWAGLGGLLDDAQARNRDPGERDRLEQALRDAGVYTAVEVATAQGWETVAWLPPPGWVAPRHIAVPLSVPAGAPLQVRLRGGIGTLQVNAIAVSEVVDPAPVESRVAVAPPGPSDGRDARAALAAVDGDRQILPDRGAYVDLAFALPPAPTDGTVRTGFLHLDGFYEVLPTSDAHFDWSAARVLARRPEDTGRVTLEIYRALRASVPQ